MPLARTPPQKSASPSKRQHTFSPSMAYPDAAFAPRSRVMRSPQGSLPAAPPPSLPQASPTAPTELPPVVERDPAPGSTAHPPSGHDEDDIMDVEADIGGPSPDLDPEAMDVEEGDNRQPQAAPATSTPTHVPAAQLVTPPPVSVASAPPLPPMPPSTPGRRAPRASIARPIHAPRTPSPERERDPNPYPEAGPSATTSAAAVPPVTPRRQSRARERTPARTPAEVLAVPAVPIADADDAGYGKYYEALVRTLRINAVDRGLGRLSFEQMKECYPLLADEKRETLENVWSNMVHELQSSTLTGAYNLLDEYRVNKRLKTFAEVIDEARTWAAEHPGEGRRDAWRPDLTPFVNTAGANLEVYDAEWEHLRQEYLDLVKECAERKQRVQEKRERLAAMDNGVSDSVVELAKTNALLKDFPAPDMLSWTEATENKLPSRKE